MSLVDTIVANPFPGLRPFHEEEEHLFFGRESQVHAMVDTLATTRFLAVVGPSGSGKSSLVNCGLRPALRRGLMTSAGTAWRMVQFRPGSKPLEAMAHALADEGVLFAGQSSDDLSMEMLVELDLRMSRRGLVEIYKQAHLPAHVNLLIVVDQFEELFRYSSVDDYVTKRRYGADEKARAFVSLLLESTGQTEHRVFVVLTMRSDFLGDCSVFPDLSEAINRGLFLVPRMKRHERREAIAGPVAVGGAEISPVLLTRLVNDVGDNPDQLSILQHALNRTWSRWEHEGESEGPLDLPHYEAIGTMARALDQHAEKAYAELGSERRQHICEKIFKALTDKGTDPRGIRRPTKLGTLCALAEADEDEVVEVIDVFRKPSRSFLMPPLPEVLTAETVIDISHESFMRVWDRLKRWADGEVASARMYGRLADAAVRYRAGQVGLLRDPELELALDWREANRPTAAWASLHRGVFPATMRFLDESLAQREKEIRDEEERRRNKLEQAQALADARGRAARRLWVGFIFAAGFALAALGAAGWAQRERDAAQESAVQAQKSAVEAQESNAHAELSAALAELRKDVAEDSRLEAEKSQLAAMASEVKAIGAKKEAEAARDSAKAAAKRDSLSRVEAEAARNSAKAAAERDSLSRVEAENSRMKTLGLALANKSVRRQELENAELRALLAREALNFNTKSKGEFAGEVFDALRLNLNELPKTRPNPFPVPHKDGVRAVAVHGSHIASAGNDGIVYLWRAGEEDANGKAPGTESLIHSEDIPVRTVALSPNGRLLASAGDDGRVLLWELRPPKVLRELKADDRSPVMTVAFSTDNRLVAAGRRDGKIAVWDTTGKPQEGPLAHTGVRAIVFSRDGKLLISGGADSKIRWWDLSVRTVQHSKDLALRAVNDLALSPDGRRLASAGEDGIVRVWSADGDSLHSFRGHVGAVNAVVFSPDGSRIASAGADGSVRLWMADRNLRNDMVLRDADRGQVAWVMDLAFSADGDSLFSAAADRKVRIWRLDAESLSQDICEVVTRPPLNSREWSEYVGPGIDHKPLPCSTKK